MNYGWRFVTLYRRQGSRPSPRKRNAKKAKWLSDEALQIAVTRSRILCIVAEFESHLIVKYKVSYKLC